MSDLVNNPYFVVSVLLVPYFVFEYRVRARAQAQRLSAEHQQAIENARQAEREKLESVLPSVSKLLSPFSTKELEYRHCELSDEEVTVRFGKKH
jgi:CRISPR/Cas system-associated protein Csm6